MTSHIGIEGEPHVPPEHVRDRANSREPSKRLSQWIAAIYVVAALATPVLVYVGPDVMSPVAPAIAKAALAGQFSMHRGADTVLRHGGAHFR